jgi:hypothetical protein
MSSLTAAEAWALAAKVYAVEAQRSGPQERAELREHAAALLEHARKLDDGADLIVRAQDYLESRVRPAAHYATPMSAADKRRALGKPSRRRGTKPASLAQTMAAACHTLKEP